jgi:hypothetical protein
MTVPRFMPTVRVCSHGPRFPYCPAVSAPEARGGERREAADARAGEDRRGRTLRLLMAPLVHRLNNCLAVVQGVHELGTQARESERELARAELAVLGQVLARLALLARPAAERRVQVDALVRSHELLLAPLAESRGVELELRAQGIAGVEVDGRLEGLLLDACTALAAGAAGGAPPESLRLLARSSPRGLVLALGVAGSVRFSGELAAVRDLARELGWRQRERGKGGACVLRLILCGAYAARTAVGARDERRQRRVLLLHGADAERELVSTLLCENGWSVSASAEEPQSGSFDVALVERRLALADPSLPARVRARFALERVELLEPRMRPGALLALLGA